MVLEEMANFFNKRVKNYENHMMNNVGGAEYYYKETAKLIPKGKSVRLLDLGCGTGLELDEIFRINPNISVIGIDLAKSMLDELANKHKDKMEQIQLVNKSYFEYDFGVNKYDVALSVQTLHHFTHNEKLGLYKKVFDSLKEDGFYIETDYMAPSQEYEDFHFSENQRIRKQMGISEGFYHYDTPCTVENQIILMEKSGFKSVTKIWQQDNTVILRAMK